MRCIKWGLFIICLFWSSQVFAIGELTPAAGTASTADGSGGGGASTLQQAFAGGKEITGANSLANAFRVGDGVTPGCFFTDATLGFLGIPCTASNTTTLVLTNFNWSLWDQEGAAAMAIADPDSIGAGSGTLNMQTSYQFGASNLGIEFAESDTNPACAAGNYNIYADTSEATLKKCVNGVASVLASGGETFVRKTSDETVNNTTARQNDDELLFAVDANSYYTFEMRLLYRSSTVADFAYEFTLPASASGYAENMYVNTAAATCGVTQVVDHLTLPATNNSVGGVGAATTCSLFVTGYVIVAGTSGTVQLKWAQATGEVSDTKVMTNSYILWAKR